MLLEGLVSVVVVIILRRIRLTSAYRLCLLGEPVVIVIGACNSIILITRHSLARPVASHVIRIDSVKIYVTDAFAR